MSVSTNSCREPVIGLLAHISSLDLKGLDSMEESAEVEWKLKVDSYKFQTVEVSRPALADRVM